MEQRAAHTEVRRTVDVPTLIVAGAMFAGFGLLFAIGGRLPWPLTIAVGGVLGAWFGSLQHEVVHGQPTSSPRINHAIVFLSLSLTYPFQRYVAEHKRHHMTDELTIPGLDPESTFVTEELWNNLGSLRRGWLWANRTVAGRLVLGPFRSTALLLWSEAGLIRRREPGVARAWALHLIGAVAVGWLVSLSDITWWEYALGPAYIGLSLTMLRSFAEHLDVAEGPRTAYVTAGRFFSLLFLNNNLHLAHHLRPGSPWHQLPAIGRQLGCAEQSATGAGLYRGYGELFRRFLVRPLHHPVNGLTAARLRR